MPNLDATLENQGYRHTVGMHPYKPSGYNRRTVYELFGFDRLLFEDEFAGAEEVYGRVSDLADIDRVIAEYEEAKKESCARYEFMQRKFDWMNWRYGYDYEDDRHYLAIQFIRWNEDNTEVEEEAEYDCMDINDGFVQFFKENPETCWNDVLDYQYI